MDQWSECAENFMHYNLRLKGFINAGQSRDRGIGVLKGRKGNKHIVINCNLRVNCMEEKRGK